MTRRIEILNGPSMNLLGVREPHVYGLDSLASMEADCAPLAATFGLNLRWRQSNEEAELIAWIEEAAIGARGIVINPGGFTFTSHAIADALAACGLPIMEVHVSNLMKRETFRHHSLVSQHADGVIAGFGVQGYAWAIARLVELIDFSLCGTEPNHQSWPN